MAVTTSAAPEIARASRPKGPLRRAGERFLSNRAATVGLVILVVMVLATLTYPLWWRFAPNDIDLLAMNQGPSAKHWLGTDGVGRDVLARLMRGGQISLMVAVISTAISIVIGFAVGAVAGFSGRLVDGVAMRAVDLAMTLPPVIFLLVLASIAGTGIGPTILVISLLSWPVLSRMVRARLLELRERDFVVAARGMGAGLPHLLFRHALPNSIDILVVFPLADDGHLGIAEGIETALSAHAIFGAPVWAALSADCMARWQWPGEVKRVTIFADAGDAGRQAAGRLADQLSLANIPSRIVAPLHGDDFNDDLQRGAAATDYAPPSAESSGPAVAEVASAPEGPSAPTAMSVVSDLEAAAEVLTNPPDVTALGMLLGRLVLARLDPLPERQILARVKSRTGIAMSVLDKQMAELRRRLNTTGDLSHRTIRPAWAHKLRLDLTGQPERNEANVITALSCDEAFAGAIVFDEFRQEIVVRRPLPWDVPGETAPRPWTDSDDVRAAEWLQRRELNVTPMTVSRSVGAVAREITVHPVRDHLGALAWDGVPRIETWTCRYLGAEDTAFNRSVGALWLISAVARIFRPGVKADHMLVLEGPQGVRKSTALKILSGEDWFTDELPELGSKDAAMHMQGVWIIEIAELDAIGKAEVSRIKAFLTRTTDRFRPPYGRYTIEVPRSCVFAGTVNPDAYLRDETGNRRFWPVRCGTINIDALARDRDLLWAEAVARFRAGAIWWLDTPELIAAVAAEQEKRYQADAWDALIGRWLTHERRRMQEEPGAFGAWPEKEVRRQAPLADVSVGEVLEQAIGLEPGRWGRADQMRVTAYLKANGWERYQGRVGDRRGALREWRYRVAKP